jgi:hypothetical protein
MLKSKTKPSNQLQALATKVEQVRAEAEAYIDARAEQLRREIPGVPIGVLRQQIMAGMAGCPCRVILKHQNEEGI